MDKVFKEGDYVNNSTLDKDVSFDAYFVLNAKVSTTFLDNPTVYSFKGTLANKTGLDVYSANLIILCILKF